MIQHLIYVIKNPDIINVIYIILYFPCLFITFLLHL